MSGHVIISRKELEAIAAVLRNERVHEDEIVTVRAGVGMLTATFPTTGHRGGFTTWTIEGSGHRIERRDAKGKVL